MVVEEVTDVDEAASGSSAVTVAEAPAVAPVADYGAPGVAVTSELNFAITILRRQYLRIRWRLWWANRKR